MAWDLYALDRQPILQKMTPMFGLARFRPSTLVLTGVVSAGAYLRFSPLHAKSLWLDEAMSARFLNFSPWEIILRSAHPRAVHPPFFFVVLHPWAWLWGDSEFALRSLAAFCGTLSILGIDLLVRELWRFPEGQDTVPREGAALLAAGLVALSPMQIEMSQNVRGYTLASTFLIFGGLAILRALRNRERSTPSWLTAAGLAVAACYTHYLAALSVAAQSLFAAAFIYRRRRDRRQLHRPPGLGDERTLKAPGEAAVGLLHGIAGRGAPWAALTFAAIFLVPWLPSLITQSENERLRSPFHMPISASEVVYQIFLALYATTDGGWYPPLGLALVAVAILVLVFVVAAAKGSWGEWYLIATGLIPLVFSVLFSCVSVRSIVRSRYLFFAQPCWLALAAMVVFRIPDRLGRSFLIAYLIGGSIYACYDNWTLIGPSAEPGTRAAVHLITSNRGDDEPIIVRSSFAYFGACYYARDRARPLLCVSSSQGSQLFGAEFLRESDLIASDRLADLVAPGVWIISSRDGSAESREQTVPDHWVLLDEWSFARDRALERSPLVVRQYRIARPSGG